MVQNEGEEELSAAYGDAEGRMNLSLSKFCFKHILQSRFLHQQVLLVVAVTRYLPT